MLLETTASYSPDVILYLENFDFDCLAFKLIESNNK